MKNHHPGGATPAEQSTGAETEPLVAADAEQSLDADAALPAGGETTPSDGGPEAPPQEAGDRAARLERERDEYYDRLLRVTAEFDNFRKRMERERAEISERAVADLIEDLLPIIDDFERALEVESTDAAYKEGVALIHRQLMEFLQRRGVQPIETVGVPFDPRVHQAVSYEAVPGRQDGEVAEEYRRGYKMGDRLLRPSMVKVAKA
ncbi:MAG TPA: nucleotide exchange factor GrpE [Vicinamibacterales bacterium]|nr:nucleotide exchange factor GrpE [Vicinamibacterales bacterium]